MPVSKTSDPVRRPIGNFSRSLPPMSGELVRFGVAMDADLLERFDKRVEQRGYATRSEALRDLVRADLGAQHVDSGGMAAATLTIIYDHHVRELSEKLTTMQHDLGECVVSTMHVHLDHDHCLEVIVLRGPAGVLQSAGDRLVATKGVEHGRMVITALPSAEHGPHHDRSHAHPHPHPHPGTAPAALKPKPSRPRFRKDAP